jgi:hypothetical protein
VHPHVAACTHLLGRSRLSDRLFVSLTCWEEQLGPHLPARGAAAPAARVEEDPGTTASGRKITEVGHSSMKMHSPGHSSAASRTASS